jgi:hypothetical protein
MTTEEPKITEQSIMMITNMTYVEDISDEDSLESGEDDSEETESESILMGSFGTTSLMGMEHHQSL